MKVNILVLDYNGRDLLAEFLPSVVEAAKASRHQCRVTVVDNGAAGDSADLLKNKFPTVSLVKCVENKVLCSYNDVARNIDDDIIILLNNDIRAEKGFVDPLVGAFLKSEDTFMAASKVLSISGEPEGSNTRARIKYGIFWASAKYKGYEANLDKEALTFSAGIGAFDRKKFVELGGYDELYLPGTLEDSDLCFRAWKRGWQCVYEPKSVIRHMGQVSFHREFGAKKTRAINARNLFLFMWKNISDKKIILGHIIFTPVRLLYALITGKTEFVSGFFMAIKQFGAARSKRKELPRQWARTDAQVFRLFKD